MALWVVVALFGVQNTLGHFHSTSMDTCPYEYHFKKEGNKCWTERVPSWPNAFECKGVQMVFEAHECWADEQSPLVLIGTSHGDWFYDDHSTMVNLEQKCTKPMPNFPFKRFGAAGFAWEHQLVLCGGRSNDRWNIYRACYQFQRSQGNWIKIPELLLGRFLPTASLMDNGTRILVSGGFTSQGFTRSTELWDGTSWIGHISLPMPVLGHCLLELDSNRLFLTGGLTRDSKSVTNTWIYQRNENTWREVEPIPQALDRDGTATKCIKMSNEQILVLGGGSSMARIFNPDTEIWSLTTPLPVWCDAPLLVLYLEMVHVIGGCGDQRSVYRLTRTREWIQLDMKLPSRMNNIPGTAFPKDLYRGSMC